MWARHRCPSGTPDEHRCLAHTPPPPPHTPSEGFQGRALGGVPRGSAPWWGLGRSPSLAFVSPGCRDPPAPIGSAADFAGPSHVTHCRPTRPHPTQPDHRHLHGGAADDRRGQERHQPVAGRAGFRDAAQRQGRRHPRDRGRRDQIHRRRRHPGAAQSGGRQVPPRLRPRLQAGGDHRLHRRQAGDLQRHARHAERRRRGHHPQSRAGSATPTSSPWPTASRCWCRAGRTTASSCAPRTWKRRSRQDQVVHAEQPVQPDRRGLQQGRT